MFRTRISAGVAAVLLIAASVFVGVAPATAGPGAAPVITLPVTGPDPDDLPTVEGDVAEDGLTVTVQVSNSSGTSTYCVDPAADIATGFSCGGAVPLPFGDSIFSATSTYTSGIPDALPSPVSNQVVFTRWDPTTPVDMTGGPAAMSPDSTPTFSGTGPALGTVSLQEANVFGDQVCQTQVLPDGTWECTVAPWGAGFYSVSVLDATFYNGTPAPVTGPGPILFDIVPPSAPPVDQTFSPWRTSSEAPDIQGDKQPDVSYIQVYHSPTGVDGWLPYCQATGVIGATIWFCDPPFGTLPLGTNYLAAIAFSEANDASVFGTSAVIERVPVPVLLSPTNGAYTNDPTPVLSGQADSGTATAMTPDESIFFCTTPVVAGAFSCESVALADGTYQWLVDVQPGSWVTSFVQTFTVDTVVAAPAITGPGTTTTSTHPVITGTAEPFAAITVYRDGAPAACAEGAVVANSAGAWSCTSAATLGAGNTFAFGAVQTDRAGNVSHAGVPPAQLMLTVLAPAAVPPAPEPTPTPSPTPPLVLEAWTFEFGLAGDEFEPGDTTEVTGSGLPPGATVDIEFHSTPVKLASTVVEPDGTFSVLVTIPEDAEAGEHHFVVLITPVEGLPSTQEQPVTVVLPAKATSQSPGTAADDETIELTGGGAADRDDPAAPSSLTGAIETVGNILSNPVVLGTAAFAGLGLLLLVAFPAELLNSTISEQYPRFSRRLPRAPWLERFTIWLERTPLFGGIAITIAAAYIFGFADPGFGFDITSLRVVLACAIALFIVGYLASTLAGGIIHRRWRLDTVMELKPLGLVLAIVGVVLSRLIEFTPGFLIGLLLGIALAGRTTSAERAKATLVQAAVVFLIAVLGWVGYSVLVATTTPDSFLTALAFDTTVAVTTEGLTALFIGLLPFKFLDGAVLFAHSKVMWAASFAVAAAAFVLIVVPAAWGELNGSLWVWLSVLGGFAVVAIGLYVYFRFFAKPIEEDEPEPVLEDARS